MIRNGWKIQPLTWLYCKKCTLVHNSHINNRIKKIDPTIQCEVQECQVWFCIQRPSVRHLPSRWPKQDYSISHVCKNFSRRVSINSNNQYTDHVVAMWAQINEGSHPYTLVLCGSGSAFTALKMRNRLELFRDGEANLCVVSTFKQQKKWRRSRLTMWITDSKPLPNINHCVNHVWFSTPKHGKVSATYTLITGEFNSSSVRTSDNKKPTPADMSFTLKE